MKFQLPWRREDDEPPETKAAYFTPATLATEFGLSGLRAPGSNVDYASEVRNGMYSSVITSALSWMMRTFPEAPVVVQRSKEDRWESIAQHKLSALLRRPNPEYGGRVLWMATIMDFCFGEAFWLKVRNGNGEVMELYWVPRQKMTPIANQKSGRRTHYEYEPGYGPKMDLELSDVVHFRFGADPSNIMRGFSPLAAVMREVYIDDAAGNFTAAILKNLGIIGVIFSPKDGTIPKEQAEALKAYVQSNFTGEKRAQAMMFTGAMNAQLLQYNLQGFDVGPIRDIVEERVSAALAIPAAVIGFGTGLQQTKVGATMREMIKLAWQGGIEPLQAIIADEMDRSLLPEFQGNADLFRTWFDTSQVEALTESPTERTDRVMKLVMGNVIKVSQAQRELGYPVDTSQDNYARELTPAPAPASPSTIGAPNRILAALDGSSNGNGNGNGNGVPHQKAADPEQHLHITMPEIDVAPAPVSIALTIEAPRAGTTRSGTMTKDAETGEYRFTTTETPDDIPPVTGDPSHDG